MTFVERQTENLRRLIEVSRTAARVPEHLRTREQRAAVAAEGGTRCTRCGAHVSPFFPVNVLCAECELELEARDQTDHPGCSWWFALVEKARGRKEE
jgi:hypothetical protein